MKKTLLFFLMLSMIFMCSKGGLVNADSEKAQRGEFSEEQAIIEELFQERANLWNGLYEEDVELEESLKTLRTIVTEPLLQFDEQAFKEAIQKPTDMDKVLGLEVIHIENCICRKDAIDAKITILWKMDGMSSEYEEEMDYQVQLKCEKEHWKIKDYSLYQ